MIINTSKLYHPQDAVKLAYQAAFGAEHLLHDVARARAVFDEEYERELCPKQLLEEIARDVVRVNLSAWKDAELPSDWLFDLFVQSSAVKNEKPLESFHAYLKELGELAKNGALLFSYLDWINYLSSNNIHDNPKPVRHSEEYRQKEKPAYRIVSGFFVRLIPILYALQGRESAVIGIDGRAASGKSTLADGLSMILQTAPIRMDDFFLPLKLRTEQRLAEPGGNVHYERFAGDVIPHLQNRKALSYRPFNCKTMNFDEPKIIPPKPFMVIEGAYCHHPFFGDYLDSKVFSDVTPNIQMTRLIKRNGKQTAEVFKSKWIPMEEKYFGTFKIMENACLVVY